MPPTLAISATTVGVAIAANLALFGAVFLGVHALFRYPVTDTTPVHRRVAAAMGYRQSGVFDIAVLRPVMSLMLHLARRIGVGALRRRVRQDLDASGNASGYTVDEQIAICLGLGFAFAAASATFQIATGSTLLLLNTPILFALGFYLPLLGLHSAAVARTQRISKQLPYTLDLVSLTMAAGSTFNEAVEVLIRDDPGDDLNAELRLVLHEIDLGTTRQRALEHLADRVPLDTLRSVVGAVNQAERLGTPMSGILKLQADMLRNQRSVRAEKLSASASMRILIPSMLILLGAVLVVFAPFIVRWYHGELLQ